MQKKTYENSTPVNAGSGFYFNGRITLFTYKNITEFVQSLYNAVNIEIGQTGNTRAHFLGTLYPNQSISNPHFKTMLIS